MVKDLEYRKIQKVGRGSYTITLPHEWIMNLGLKKGNQVALEVQDDLSLLVLPNIVLKERKEDGNLPLKEYKIYVDPKDDPQSVCRRVTSLYVVSTDLVHINFKKGKIPPEHKTAISYLSKNLLLGSEIINETSSEITLQILIKHPDFPIEKAIRRMAILALSANREAILTLKTKDEKLTKNVITTYNDVNRLNLYVIRQLKYGLERNLFEDLGFKTQKEFLGYRIVVNDIKSIADNALSITNNIAALKKMILEEILLLNEPIDEETYSQILAFNSKVLNFFEETLKALFKRDYNLADKLVSDIKPLTTLEKELITMITIKKTDPNISSIFRLILDSSRKIIEHGRNIAEVTLNRTVEETSQPV